MRKVDALDIFDIKFIQESTVKRKYSRVVPAHTVPECIAMQPEKNLRVNVGKIANYRDKGPLSTSNARILNIYMLIIRDISLRRYCCIMIRR